MHIQRGTTTTRINGRNTNYGVQRRDYKYRQSFRRRKRQIKKEKKSKENKIKSKREKAEQNIK